MIPLCLLLLPPDVSQYEAAVKRQPNAANYRRLADQYVAARRYADASAAFDRASALYRKLGDPNAALVLTSHANRYRTTARLFFQRPIDPERERPGRLAIHEPAYGCYVGANIEREYRAPSFEEFNEAVGKNHAFFFYRQYGGSYPKSYTEMARRANAGLQISLEPRSLDEVQDGVYLRRFARDLREARVPVFLRFASEMNGPWVPYHGDPKRYIETFRMVARVMHEEAPNVAMVWCPNAIPEDEINAYYPGEDAVDWVGVNFYSVPYNDANRARGAEWRHPADSLDYVYRSYASRHPIMVGEWAASHHSVVDNVDRPEFAANKIGQFYSALPRLYPRVKAVHWLSMNTIQHASGARKLNNYSLLDHPEVTLAYGRAVGSEYFLGQAPAGETFDPGFRVEPLKTGSRVAGEVVLSAFVRTYEQRPKVTYIVDGRRYPASQEPGAYELRLPGLTLGKHRVVLEVHDSTGRLAGRSEAQLAVE